ncbi:MAG: NFACT family protein, partial [Clostridia bacterium]|nr:NFACT family protein [Clostridia bacterium]
MPYDGIVASGVVWELSGLLTGGRIEKIYQTEQDELVLLCHLMHEKYRLLLSASPNNPRIHLTNQKKENPMSAPPFCMVLRKHIQGGRIAEISQAGYDRIISIKIDTFSELGDPVTKTLIIEIMGRHSNIMLVGPTGIIYDSIRHIDSSVNSLRELLPARPYILPPQQNKLSPDKESSVDKFIQQLKSNEFTGSISSCILASFSGFSPLLCKEISISADINPSSPVHLLSEADIDSICNILYAVCSSIANHIYRPAVILKESEGNTLIPTEFHCVDEILKEKKVQYFSSVNLMLDEYFTAKDNAERQKQKKSSLHKYVSSAISRTLKKIQIHETTLHESENYDFLRIKGELLTSNMYLLKGGEKNIEVINYYSENADMITIELDEHKSPAFNAQSYFKKYRKKKSAYENAKQSLEKCFEELEYLRSVETLLESCTENADIADIRSELAEQGYANAGAERKVRPGKAKNIRIAESSPISAMTSDGYEVLIGKNN